MVTETTLIAYAARFALVVLLLSVFLALARLIRGPDAADRVVALDLVSVLIVAILAAYSIYSGETSFLDVAIGYALIAFLGTVALARFLMLSARKKSQTTDSTDKVSNNE